MPPPTYIEGSRVRAVPPRERLSVMQAGVAYPVTVKRVAAARRFTLRVRAASQEAVLTMPPRASLRAALAFAQRHADWIGTRLAALPGRIPLLPGTLVPLRGQDHRIVLDPALLRRARAGTGDDGAPTICVATSLRDPAAAAYGFLLGEARRDLEAAVRRHAATVGRTVGRVTLRDTRSRWGSCSSRGTLNFSWRLILAPPFVLDYLAAHEVAHLVHMDHSNDFWRVVRSLAPATDEAERWLKVHGPGLHRFGAA